MIGGCALLISACWIASAKADFPRPITPPISETLTPIGPVTSPAKRPNNSAKPTSQTVIVDAARRHVPVLIEQMLNNQLTPQEELQGDQAQFLENQLILETDVPGEETIIIPIRAMIQD